METKTRSNLTKFDNALVTAYGLAIGASCYVYGKVETHLPTRDLVIGGVVGGAVNYIVMRKMAKAARRR